MHTEPTSEHTSHRSKGRHHKVADAAALVVERARLHGTASTAGMLPVELRETIIRLCAAARAEQMTVERLIVVLKEKWATLPEVRRLPRGGEKDTALACVITQCIQDFYTPGHLADSAVPMNVDINTSRGDSI